LSIKLDATAPDGFLTHSFSGDDTIACRDHVRAKCGLPEFKPNGRRPRRSSDEVAQLLRAAVRSQQEKPQGRLVAGYRYTDKDGALLYEVLRYEPKTFRQRRPDGAGGWIWKLEDRRVLYRLQELLKYPDATVFITEGEKDADRIAELGHCATTIASGKWTDECVQALAGRDVMILEDNDDAGRKKALEAATLLHGTAATIRIVRLPGLPDGGDLSDWMDAGHNGDQLVEACLAAPVWTSACGEIPQKVRENSAPVPGEQPSTPSPQIAPAADPPPLQFINVTAWHGQPVPEREWCVLNRIPMRNVTLFSEGAIGKSIVSLQLSVAHVLGKDWLGALPEPGPVIVVACEDEEGELHRRLSLILDHYGAAFTDLKDLYPLSMAGEDALLAAPDRNGLMQPTKLFGQLHNAACDIRPKLIVLDNSADIFGGSENDRTQVRQFIGILRGLSISANAGILLTSHPSLTGMNTGTGLSGSTAWHASVRSRLYMKRTVTAKDEEPDPDVRVIEVMKSNYGPVGETITVRWKEGVFVPTAGMSTLDKLAAEQKADESFYGNVVQFTQQGRNVSHKPTANAYAPTEFAKEKEAKEAGIKKTDFEAAMRRLLTAGKIRVESYGPPSRGWTRLVTT
jgi:RecA-family ATPase